VSAARRIAAVALLRYREGARGSLVVFLLAFLGLSIAACLLVPGEPGPERQRVIDRLVFGAALLVSALAAASLAAAPDPGDRAAGRDAVLSAGPLRPAEGIAGAWLGHGACLVILLAGMFAGALAITGLLSGGDRDRRPTRTAVFPERLEGPDGRAAAGPVVLLEAGQAATYVLREPDLAPDGPEVTVRISLYSGPDTLDFPESFPVAVTVGTGEAREVRVRRTEPLRFHLNPEEAAATRELPIRIQRRGPVYALGLAPGGLVVEGRRRSHAANLAKALLAWLGGLLVLAAAAAALGTFVQAPVAVAGALLLALTGRSLGLLEEAARYLSAEESGGRIAASALSRIVAIWPDLTAADLTDPVTAGWDIASSILFDRLPATLIGAGVFLGAAWAVVAIRRRR